MPSDPIRDRLRELLRRNDLTMKSASAAIGRNPAYLHQYLTRDNPRVLGYRDSEALAKILRCDPDELRHPTVPPRRPPKRRRRRPPSGCSGGWRARGGGRRRRRLSRAQRGRRPGRPPAGTFPTPCCARRTAPDRTT